MNLEEAHLIGRVLERLTGSLGKPLRQLADECRISYRRMTYLAICLEKAGLVSIDANEIASLSETLAATAWAHAREISPDGDIAKPWEAMAKAVVLMKKEGDRQFNELGIANIFNEIFGVKK